MLSTLVIGLREGLEAALIVGIVAAFLRTNGRPDLLRWVWAGVAAAVVLCLGVGIALKLASQNLPYRQQESLETVIALVAVGMVTYMVVWMRCHARTLKSDLEGAAGTALDAGSGWALVAMAFLAVLREGFETAVFLVAAFNESDNPATATAGAMIGIAVACGLGYGIYTGGFRINLAKFFRITGVVLVLVSAGLVMSALHSAHEAGWVNVGQQQVADMTWLVRPGSIRSSLLTGMLGWQPRPVALEVIGYFAYLVPVMAFVLWPAGRPFPRRAVTVGAAATAVVAATVAGVLAVARPDSPAPRSRSRSTIETSAGGRADVTVIERSPDSITFTVAGDDIAGAAGGTELVGLASGTQDRGGRDAIVYRSEPIESAGPATSQTLSLDEVAAANGGRLPLGVNATSAPDGVEVDSTVRQSATLWVDDETGTILDVAVATTTRSVAHLASGPMPLGAGAAVSMSGTDDSVAAHADDARDRASRIERADAAWDWMLASAVVAALAVASLIALVLAGRFSPDRPPSSPGRGHRRDAPAHPRPPLTTP